MTLRIGKKDTVIQKASYGNDTTGPPKYAHSPQIKHKMSYLNFTIATSTWKTLVNEQHTFHLTFMPLV